MRENWPAARRKLRQAACVSILEAAAIVALKAVAAYPYLFRKDLGIPQSSKVEGVDKFAAFMASLSEPLLIALAAVAPLALIFGAGALRAARLCIHPLRRSKDSPLLGAG